MLAYQLRLALLSLRRNPVLSLLIVGGIGLGIAVAMTFVTVFYGLSGNPIPGKSDVLHYVQVDSWSPDSAWDDDDPSEPPDQLTYMDAMALLRSEIPTHQAAMYKTNLTLHPAERNQRPFRESVRLTFGDFFTLFDVPFRYGTGWSAASDAGPEPVIVLGDALNQRLFGGENSVGRTLRIEDRDFRVIGVIEPWQPRPKFYDPLNNQLGDTEEVFMPFHWGDELEIRTSGNTSCWGGGGSSYADLLQSECVWIQMWVQLDTPQQRESYATFLDAYTDGQRGAGRFPRPNNHRLRDVMAWLDFQQVVPDEAYAMLINALLFLLVCSVNLIGILLGKFLGRASEIGVRRALGASRRWVFTQHLIECELIGVVGALLGLGLSVFGLRLLDRLYQSQLDFRLDLNMFIVALLLALASALVAGLYPAWRICRIQPGLHLKTQ